MVKKPSNVTNKKVIIKDRTTVRNERGTFAIVSSAEGNSD